MRRVLRRAQGLAWAALLLLGACAPQGRLRPQPQAARLAQTPNAAVAEAHGVRLVAIGASWQGQPRDIERYFTLVELHLENHSGRPLSVRYEFFELVGEERHAAIPPPELRRMLMAGEAPGQPPARSLARSGPFLARQAPRSRGPDTTYSPYNGTTPFGRQRCLTCPPPSYARTIPTPDMLRLAFREGPLEDGRTRQGFLYFPEARQLDRIVILEARLADARTGEAFGVLSIPFEVY